VARLDSRHQATSNGPLNTSVVDLRLLDELVVGAHPFEDGIEDDRQRT
jgi:hypothetical protein